MIHKDTINASMHINKLSNKKVDYPLVTQAHALTTKTFINPLQEKGNGNLLISLSKKRELVFPILKFMKQ